MFVFVTYNRDSSDSNSNKIIKVSHDLKKK